MRIKKHSNGNTYLLTNSGYWIRNFCSSGFAANINNLTEPSDYALFLENESRNKKFILPTIDVENFDHPYCVIVSDGYKFEETHKILEQLPNEISVFSVNRSLANWKANRRIDFHIINNPYDEALADFPRHRYFPPCIASSKTNHLFIENYLRMGGMVYKYAPVQEQKYKHIDGEHVYLIDDYRNPICAAISLAYHFKVRKLLLLCCDESFKDSRPGAIELKNGLYTYPQQQVAHEIIDGHLYWLKKQEYMTIETAHCSHDSDYENAVYIKTEEIEGFFK